MSVSFEVCTKPHIRFEWKLNGVDLPSDVIVDQSGTGIMILEVHEKHFGLYEFAAINTENEREEKRTFRISCKPNGTLIGYTFECKVVFL